jgi:hypothetical protein
MLRTRLEKKVEIHATKASQQNQVHEYQCIEKHAKICEAM